MLEKVVGKVLVDKTIMDSTTNLAPKAPGMKYKHYAPKGELTIVEGIEEEVVDKINELTGIAREKGERVGVIGTERTVRRYFADSIKCAGSREDEETIAHNLYRILREFDDEEITVIYSESFESLGIGQAIMNRLIKAAGHKVIHL